MSVFFLTANGQRIDFAEIPAGKFMMGSVNELPFALETPVHEAVIERSFLVSVFPVTQAQFEAVTGKNPSVFRHADNLPVENINWFEAKEFCRKISEITGKTVRLPTETEWEYAARAGSATDYFFGVDKKLLGEYAWFESNSGGRTRPVGLKRPNNRGLYDTAGNVWEWCEDVWKSDYTDFPADGSPNLHNISKQHRRSTRGGSWAMDAFRCRSSYRSFDWYDATSEKLGFRIVWQSPD